MNPVNLVNPGRVIEPSSGWAPIGWGELWEYRELFGFLVWRDVKVRYKQTVLGAAWAVLQPLTTMAMFTLLFGRLGEDAVRRGAVPAVRVRGAAAVDVLLECGQRRGGEPGRQHPSDQQGVLSAPAGLADVARHRARRFRRLARRDVRAVHRLQVCRPPRIYAAAVRRSYRVRDGGRGRIVPGRVCGVYRDVRYVVPLLMQLWMFASPVIYPASLVPPRWRWIYQLNPMAGVIGGFRSALLGVDVPWGALASAAASVCCDRVDRRRLLPARRAPGCRPALSREPA